MAFVTSSSRFSVLMDDVQDPFDQKKKNKKPHVTTHNNKNSGKGNNQKVKPTPNGPNNQQSKKSKPNTNGNAVAKPKPPPAPTASATGTDPSQPNKASANGDNDKPLNLPRMDPEWERRDGKFVEGNYEKDLEEALVQSKLDFQVEQKRALDECTKLAKNPKKKPAPISLAEFNNMLRIPTPQNAPRENFDDLDFLTEQFRKEAKIELDKQRQREKEKTLLATRSSEINGHALVENEPTNLDEKDLLIQQLSSRNEDLEQEVVQLKTKLKKAGELLTNADLKDKAMLVKDLAALSKVNEDMNEELRAVYSQLEQERSKSHATAIELRKMVENRRRTQSHTESQQ